MRQKDTHNEVQPLINAAQINMLTPPKSENKSNPFMIKIVSFGVGSVLIAVNLTGNSLQLTSLGHSGAGSLTTSFQSLFLGICGGALMSGGVALGKPMGEKDFVKASEIVKASYALTMALTAFSTIAYSATYFAFPALFYSQ